MEYNFDRISPELQEDIVLRTGRLLERIKSYRCTTESDVLEVREMQLAVQGMAGEIDKGKRAFFAKADAVMKEYVVDKGQKGLADYVSGNFVAFKDGLSRAELNWVRPDPRRLRMHVWNGDAIEQKAAEAHGAFMTVVADAGLPVYGFGSAKDGFYYGFESKASYFLRLVVDGDHLLVERLSGDTETIAALENHLCTCMQQAEHPEKRG